jgi:hypothetical protein
MQGIVRHILFEGVTGLKTERDKETTILGKGRNMSE